MSDKNRNNFFIVNELAATSTVKQELFELLSIVDFMLQIVSEKLNSTISCPTRLCYIQTWQQHLKITYQLYQLVYCESVEIKLSEVFFINIELDRNTLRDMTTAYIYQLQSLCHLAAEVVFTNNINSHLRNSLIIINDSMQRAVYLVDMLALNEFEFIKDEKIPSAQMVVNA